MIIIKEFLARLDVAQRIDEDPVVFLERFAVWIAGMIDPARVVTANFWIDYIAVFQTEVESVWIVVVIGSGFPGDAFACVLDDPRAFGYELRGVNAPAVHARLANVDLHGPPPSFAFLRHAQSWNYFLVLKSACDGIDPILQSRRLFYAGVPETYNSDRPPHTDNLLSVAYEIWERERRQAEAIKSGRSLREQLDFARYLEKRVADPNYTFREHLRKISGAIEE